jgi:hypothetical protein
LGLRPGVERRPSKTTSTGPAVRLPLPGSSRVKVGVDTHTHGGRLRRRQYPGAAVRRQIDLKIAVAMLVALTVSLMAVLWLLGKPTQRFAPEIAAAPPTASLVPWLASLAGQDLGGRTD